MRLTEEDEGADTSTHVHDEPGGERKAMRNGWLDSFVDRRLLFRSVEEVSDEYIIYSSVAKER
jgi:hypothetical protein